MRGRKLLAMARNLMMAVTVLMGLAAPATAQRARPDTTPLAPPSTAVISPDGLRAAWATDKDRSIVSATRASLKVSELIRRGDRRVAGNVRIAQRTM